MGRLAAADTATEGLKTGTSRLGAKGVDPLFFVSAVSTFSVDTDMEIDFPASSFNIFFTDPAPMA